MSKIKCLKVTPYKAPEVVEIEKGLESLQKQVGGMIEAVYPFEDEVAVICNEEGKLLRLPANRPLRDDNGRIYDILCGDFLVVGLGEEDFASLSDELIAKYREVFA